MMHTHLYILIIQICIHVCVNYTYIHTHNYTQHTRPLGQRESQSQHSWQKQLWEQHLMLVFQSPVPIEHWGPSDGTFRWGPRWDLHTQELHTREEPWSYIGCSPPDLLLTQG